MLKKERDFPLKLKLEEALLRRLPSQHQKCEEIRRNIRKGRAGYRGELEVDYHLSFLPEEEYLVFQNLCLLSEGRPFQIDTLILSPWFALIIECKNIYGHLFFDPIPKQLIRTYEQHREGFPDPLLQAKRQQLQLQKWMAKHMLKTCPVHFLVAIGYPSTIVETKPGNEQIYEKVLHAEQLPDQIISLAHSQTKRSLSSYQLRKLSDLFLAHHQIAQVNIFDYYKITPQELTKGVPCPSCSQIPMQRMHGKWKCELCGSISSQAHEQVIQDYLLLHGSITNEECRELLELKSRHTTRRILSSMNLPVSGIKKGTVYTREFT